jgi:hypothetical protein
MKNTSRRSFGEQLAVAIVTFLVIAFSSIATFGQQTATQSKDDKDCQRKEHDTPPPTLLMSGSWIFEVRTERNHDWSTRTATMEGGRTAYSHYVPAHDRCGAPATKPIHIAHIKIVDGSGEMLYRLDNDDKDHIKPIKIKTFMSADKAEFISVNTDAKNFVVTFFENRKLEKEEPSMDPEPEPTRKRQRALYKDNSGENKQIFGIEVVKDDYTVYGLKLDSIKAARELRIMIWWEEN